MDIYINEKIDALLKGKTLDGAKAKVNPDRDWFLLVVGFAIVFVLVVSFNMYVLFAKHDDIGAGGRSDSLTVAPRLNKDRIANVSSKINMKKEKFNNLVQEKIRVSDPSL